MLSKIFAIGRKDIYITFKDRNAMLYLLVTPLALSTIIGLAFGTSGDDVSIDAVPVTVINQDAGELGQTYEQVLVHPGAALADLVDGTSGTNLDAARDDVENGDTAALVHIPADFSERAHSGQPSTVDVYYDSGRSIGPSVVMGIVNGITNGMNTVLIGQRVAASYLPQLGVQLGQDEATIGQAIGEMSQSLVPQSAAALAEPIQLQEVDAKGKKRVLDMLQYFAPSMAILFMTFAMAAGTRSILNEQNDWTLQRIITTPTPRWVFMAGKLLGTYITGLIQMAALIALTSLVAKLMGRETAVWGHNYLGVVIMVLIVVFAGTGLALVIAALSHTVSQAETYSTGALFLLGMLGGSFIPIENLPGVMSFLPKISLNYWGIQGFVDLSYNDASLADIAPNLLVLAAMGALLFVISLWRFNRRLDI